MLKQISPKSLNHPIDTNIIQLHGIYYQSILTTFECFYELGDYWLIMPYFQSISLQSLVKLHYSAGINDQTFVRYVLSSVLNVLNRIHCCSSQLKSLKPSKIVLSQSGDLKVLDCEVTSTIREILLHRKTVDPYWNAPEVINGSIADSRSDIWSFGLLVVFLITGKNPWENYPYMKAALMITQKPCFRLGRDASCENFLRNVVECCLQKDPEKRPTAAMLLENPYFSKFNGKKHAGCVIGKVLNVGDQSAKKIESMLQPRPLSGEDPDEMLDLDIEPEH